MKKIITSTILLCCLISTSCITTFAKEKPHDTNLYPYQIAGDNNTSQPTEDNLPQPRWWPGDPNPQPGSQEWLWTHAQTKPNSSAKAKKCGKQALLHGGFKGSAESAVVAWLVGGTFTLGAFVATFGIGFGVEYFSCIIS